jgi:hypothetical protein
MLYHRKHSLLNEKLTLMCHITTTQPVFIHCESIIAQQQEGITPAISENLVSNSDHKTTYISPQLQLTQKKQSELDNVVANSFMTHSCTHIL